MTNEWIDLVDDPGYPRTPLHGGYVLRTGRKGLMALLEEWQAAGVNHAALGIQFSQRPPAEVLEELARGAAALSLARRTVGGVRRLVRNTEPARE
jgi:hypothetical protein